MTEAADAKVSLIDEFKGLTMKQWIAILGAFMACVLLIITGIYSLMCLGFFLVAVILYMVPHITGVTSPKIKAVVGAVFIVVMLMIGTFGYDDAYKDSQTRLIGAQTVFGDIHYENGFVYAESEDATLNMVLLSAPVTEMTFGNVTNYDRNRIGIIPMTYADGRYTASVGLMAGAYQLVEVARDINNDQKSFEYFYMIYIDNGVQNKTEMNFAGAAYLLGMIAVIYFVMLVFSELMRRGARKTRAKMEAEGRLYPQGYSKCKECGTMVLPGEVACRKCGALIEVPEELKVHKKDFFQCSECGTEVPKDAKVCPKCGASFDEQEETEIIHADGTVDVSTETFECSECGKKVPANAKKCPYCGADFDEDDE